MAQPEVKLPSRLSDLSSSHHSVILRYKAVGESSFQKQLSRKCVNKIDLRHQGATTHLISALTTFEL